MQPKLCEKTIFKGDITLDIGQLRVRFVMFFVVLYTVTFNSYLIKNY